MARVRLDIGNGGTRERRRADAAGPPSAGRRPADELRLSEVLAGLTAALDLTEGQPVGHSVRSCMIGMRIASMLGLPEEERSDLMHGLLLKDLGCSSNAARVCHLFGADDHGAKRALKLADWTHPIGAAAYAARQVIPDGSLRERIKRWVSLGLEGRGASRRLVEVRCERGAELAAMLGLPTGVCEAIRALDEHFDGEGHPRGLAGDEIPLAARVMGLAQTADVFFTEAGPDAAADVVEARSGTWFDPELVRVFARLHRDGGLWTDLGADDLLTRVLALEPSNRVAKATDENLDRVARVFSWVIDAKSPWTLLHSENVARIALGMAKQLDLSVERQRDVYRAGLLHDIGKLGVSNLILDKPGTLSDAEWSVLEAHPTHTREILGRVPYFETLAAPAAAHHERLDGEGYDLGLEAGDLGSMERILAVADRFEAMSAYRPYRAETPVDEVLRVLAEERGAGVCPEALEALEAHLAEGCELAPDSLASARRAGRASRDDRMEWLDLSRRVQPSEILRPATVCAR